MWHRPSLKDIPFLREAGCDSVVTLLSEKEGAREIGKAVRRAKMEWIWLPLGHAQAKPPEGQEREAILLVMPKLSALLDRGMCLLIHCSAGIHRTGMVAYTLLRWRGHGEEESLGADCQYAFAHASGSPQPTRAMGQ